MNVAFIPVRGGSKSIPLKNIKNICGRPLVYWSMKAACDCKYIDKVYIATDSDAIRDTINNIKASSNDENLSKAEVIGRSAESATDTASTEFAMLEFAEGYDFDYITLIQATSPLIDSSDIEKGFELINSNEADSVLSVVRQKRFNWQVNDDGTVSPTNYDVFNRPRRQEFNGYLVENGAFYITSKERLLSTKNRISGRIKAVEMSEDTFFEIDEPSDWIVIEHLMNKKLKDSQNSADNYKNIKMLLTDCDGCLTDGGMYYSEVGDESKKFNTRDGMAFGLLREKGILTGMITGEDVKLNRRRAAKLKLDIYIPGCKDKLSAVRKLCEDYKITLDEVCYIGDDINDLEIIKAVGMGCCPANAVESVRNSAGYIAKANGGEGVIREVAELIL